MKSCHICRFLPAPAFVIGWVLVAAAPAHAELNLMQVAPGVYTGSAPETAADLHMLRQLGVKTVVDMRKFRPHASRRDQQAVQRYGMVYRHVPVGLRPTRDGSPHCVLRIMSDPSNHPVFIHCSLGRDRTGLVVALYRVKYLGWSAKAAYAAMERQQFNPLLRDIDRYFWQSV